LLHPLRVVIEFPAILVYCIGGDGVVVEGVGWASQSDVLNQSREVFPVQQAEDAIGVPYSAFSYDALHYGRSTEYSPA
jgi:hypothetical protein